MPYLVLTLLSGKKTAIRYSAIESVTECLPKPPKKTAKGCFVSTGGNDGLEVQEDFEQIMEAIDRCESDEEQSEDNPPIGVAANEQ